MSTENFFLAFGRSLPVWCAGTALGWSVIPLMNANMDALLRGRIPVEMQGRVFSVRNTFQFLRFRSDMRLAACWWIVCLNL